MSRDVVATSVLLVVCVLGCAPKDPPPAAAQNPTEPATSVVTAPVAATLKHEPQPSPSPTISAPPPTVASPYRELAARLLESDGHGGWRKNEKAATEMEKLSAEEMAQLWPLLRDTDAAVRRGAAVVLLGIFNPTNSEQVAWFTALLHDDDRMVRARAIDAVKQFADADKAAALPRLRGMLDPQREDRPENRAAIVRLLGSLKSESDNSLLSLPVAASDPDAKVRAAALVAIAQLNKPEFGIPILAKGLADSDSSVRLVAAARLRQIGSPAASAAKQLAATLADSSGDVAEAAAEALIRIGPAAVEPLAGQLSSKTASARKLALACLAQIGPPAKSALPQIEKCKQDADPQVRQLADAALKRISGQ